MVTSQEDSREGICPICQEPLKVAVRTQCNHLFCRPCLAQHLKAAAPGDLCCPVCREPCSEGVLGEGYICPLHQKWVCRFCEESRQLLCVQCLESPEHRRHTEPTIEGAVSHYKERLNRRSRKLRKDVGELPWPRAPGEEELPAAQFQAGVGSQQTEAEPQRQRRAGGEQDALLPRRLQGPGGPPAEGARSLGEDPARRLTLATELENLAKDLDASTLKDAADLLERSAPQKLGVLLSLLPPTDPAPPRVSSGPPSPEHIPVSSSSRR